MPPSWFKGEAPGKGKEEEEGGKEGVLECPNSELASLMYRAALASSPSGSTKCILLLFKPKIVRAILMTKQNEVLMHRIDYSRSLTTDPKPIF